MIERFYLKDYISFKEVELNLDAGLVVFTGPSGSGKSLLMSSIIASLGSLNCEASLCESSVTWDIDENSFGIYNDEINIFKHIKKEKSRYFINNQSVSKKTMNSIANNYFRHLNLKDFSDFENTNLISILDNRIFLKSNKLSSIKEKYQAIYLKHKDIKSELDKISQEQKKIVELKEFTAFEIKKIEDVNPNISEDEELMRTKRELSKKEKVTQNIDLANGIFDFEHNVYNALNSLDIEPSFIEDALNELRAILDNAQERFSALEDVDIEEVLNRIEELSALKRRYGGIKEAIEYKEQKIIELKKYENIDFTKESLEHEFEELSLELQNLASKITSLRSKELKLFNKDLNRYLKELYLKEIKVEIKKIDFTFDGVDELVLKLNDTELSKISTGEFNRLRLGILALKSETMSQNGGILMLDEIDANLSGEESMSVAKVLRQLSKYFQIFVISHQPQLTSTANQHFLVYKDKNLSKVKELDFNGRVDEIARIISGESVTNEAKTFAKELMERNICV